MKKLFIITTLFFCARTNAQSLHGDLETWRNFTVLASPALEAPAYWNVADSMVFYAAGLFTSAVFTQQVYQSTDAHSGSKAAKLVTRKEDTLQVLPALLTNTNISIDIAAYTSGSSSYLMYTGGTPVTSRIPEVSAWVKYFPNGIDTGSISVQAIKSGAGVGGSDSIVGSGRALITGVCSSYTLFTAGISYNDTFSVPDLLRVFVRSSAWAPHDSSTLYIDDIGITALSVTSAEQSSVYSVYPVPADDHITFSTQRPGQYELEVLSADGKEVANYALTRDLSIDLSKFPSGPYYYLITNKMTGEAERGRFILYK